MIIQRSGCFRLSLVYRQLHASVMSFRMVVIVPEVFPFFSATRCSKPLSWASFIKTVVVHAAH